MELQIIEQNGQLLVDSREVSEMVGISHPELLKRIEGTTDGKYKGYIPILEKGNFTSQNFFIKSSYKGQRREEKCYLLTKKGCDMVANKLTGEKGILFTATYVTKFESMEKELKNKKFPSYMIEDPIARAERWIQEQRERKQLETQKLMLEQQVKENESKVTYYNEILKSKDVVNITQIAKDYGLSGKALNNILREEKVQYKQNKQWLLYSKYQDKGYTKSHTQEYLKSDGEIGYKLHTKWTQIGRLFIHTLLTKRGIEAVMDREESKVS